MYYDTLISDTWVERASQAWGADFAPTFHLVFILRCARCRRRSTSLYSVARTTPTLDFTNTRPPAFEALLSTYIISFAYNIEYQDALNAQELTQATRTITTCEHSRIIKMQEAQGYLKWFAAIYVLGYDHLYSAVWLAL